MDDLSSVWVIIFDMVADLELLNDLLGLLLVQVLVRQGWGVDHVALHLDHRRGHFDNF